jgi:hypothetical protein
MPPAQGASIALFILLAAMVTPEPPPRGVGLRGVIDARLKGPVMPAAVSRPASGGPMAAGPRRLPDSPCAARLERAEGDAAPSCAGRLRARPAGVAPGLSE